MYYVYIQKSKLYPEQYYIGFTRDLTKRLIHHNAGKTRYTNKFKPWEVETYIHFKDKKLALDFERYLKTGSGIAFRNKRLVRKV